MSSQALPAVFRCPAHERRLDDCAPEIRIGLIAIAGLVGGGLLWASVARLDAAVAAPGSVKISGDSQSVQSLEGGIVSALRVHEGQHVEQGQALVDFASLTALSQERSLASRVINLRAEIACLTARQHGEARVAEPESFAKLTGDDRAEAASAMTLARAQCAADAQVSASQVAIASQRNKQISTQIAGTAQQYEANKQQQNIGNTELRSLQSLADKGFAPRNRVLDMERSIVVLKGDSGSQQAEMARLRAQSAETRLQLIQLRQQDGETRTEKMQTEQSELQSLLPQWSAALDTLTRTRVTAPVAGTVMGLSIHGPGAVAGPGQKLMEVVPDNRSLVIDAEIGVNDANDLEPGQPVMIRVTGLHGFGNPMVRGSLLRVSADNFTDERTGRPYYRATFQVATGELEKLRSIAHVNNSLRPGTPVQIEVPLRKRTALQYWIEPLTQAVAGSLHEN